MILLYIIHIHIYIYIYIYVCIHIYYYYYYYYYYDLTHASWSSRLPEGIEISIYGFSKLIAKRHLECILSAGRRRRRPGPEGPRSPESVNEFGV